MDFEKRSRSIGRMHSFVKITIGLMVIAKIAMIATIIYILIKHGENLPEILGNWLGRFKSAFVSAL